MLLKELMEQYVPKTIEGIVTAYHGGNGFEGEFDLNRSGTGEGYRILGPGMYFITNKWQAGEYARKYGRTNPTVYTAQIDTYNFYNSPVLPTDDMQKSMDAIEAELGFGPDKKLPWARNTLNSGRGFIGSIVEQVGHKKALALFLKHGINGAVEHIGDGEGMWEICVFNMKVVQITAREPIKEADVVPN